MRDLPPADKLGLQEVTTRHSTARLITVGFSTALPALADYWQQIDSALIDTPALIVEVARVRAELADVRLSHANLVAAGQATIAAHHDGEPDALFYLRDELHAQRQTRRRHR